MRLRLLGLPLVALLFAWASPAAAAEPVATFSIVACDPETGELGVAVQSKFFAVGAVVPWARAGVGAIATQAYGNTTFGPRGLERLAAGEAVDAVLAALLASDSLAAQRQVGIVDARGSSAAHTGADCLAWAGHRTGPKFSVQGNILTGEAVVDAMAEAYLAAEGEMLGERLLRALEAGQAAGGDARGRQSAALLVVREGGGYGGYNDRYCDLRVDDHAQPIVELRRIFGIWKVDALILEGYRRCEEGDWDGAFAAGREAVGLAPLSGEPYYHLACYLSKAGRREEALAELDAAVRRDAALGVRARQDPDFKPHWQDPEFLGITGR
jgi:uncharacterized Ntn-hydrolase superfamily protein